MRLIHHDKEIVTLDYDRLYPIRERDSYIKPNGLWVSDEDDYGWSHWCTAEEFRTEGLIYSHLVELYPDCNVLLISTTEELDKFHEEFKTRYGDFEREARWLNWPQVYRIWQGVIVTPYLWERRMDYMWYYGWDCAGGCIWDLRAIRTFQPLLKQLTWR